MAVPHPKGGGGRLFGILWRIIFPGKKRSTNQLYCVALIINYFKKMSMGMFEREYMGIHI